MKLSKKLFAAAATLGLAAAATVGSTYAWFSLNDQVAVTGMTATTKTENNLFVASDPSAEANFNTQLSQARTGRLRPVSTVNGESFFYTTNALGNGDAKTDSYTDYSETTNLANSSAGKDKYDADFNTAYKAGESITTTNVLYGYIDYTFYLKATSAEANQKVYLKECELKTSETTFNDKAWRVALFASAAQDNVTGLTSADTSKLNILTISGAENQTSNEAVSSVTGLASVSYNTSDVAIDTIAAAGATKYYKVIVRLWLEGEDTTCTNQTYAALTNAFTLGLTFEIGTGTPANVITPAVTSAP